MINLHRFAELRNLPFEKVHISDKHFNDQRIFLEKKAKFHKSCQLKISTLKLERLERSLANKKDGDESEKEEIDPPTERRKSGRLNQFNDQPNEEKETTCFFCHEETGKLHNASTYKLNNRVLEIAKKLNDIRIINKLTEKDMMASWESVYHSDCLIKFYKKGKEIERSEKDGIDLDDQISCTAFVELTNYMSDCVEDDKSTIFKLDDLIKLYEKRISDLGGKAHGKIHSTRFKNRLLSHFENLVESKKEGRYVYLLFDDELGCVLKTVFENSFDDGALYFIKGCKNLTKRNLFRKIPIFSRLVLIRLSKRVPASLC